MEPINHDHLRACPEHRLVGGGAGGSGLCPACETDVEARPDFFAEHADRPLEPLDVQWQVEDETMLELIPLMEAYLEDVERGPLWVSVGELPEDMMPAGYTKQERWVNVVQYQHGSQVKSLIREQAAQETIETLREEGYADE